MGCATSHRVKWGPFSPNEVGRLTQHIRKGEEKIEGKDRRGHIGSVLYNYFVYNHGYQYIHIAVNSNGNEIFVKYNT